MCLLQLIPQVSSLTWVTTFVPLFAVMLVTAIKDILEDIVSLMLEDTF